MEIVPNVHQVPDVTANVFIIIEDQGLTLIDAGLPRSDKKIIQYLDTLGYTSFDIKHIIITHADLDHFGGLAPLQRASQAVTYASQIEAQAIREGGQSRDLKLNPVFRALFSFVQMFVKPEKARVDEIVSGGQRLRMLGGLQVVETPGHTPGHISLFAPEAGLLFCGDALLCPDGEIQVSSGINTWNQEMALESARVQAELEPRIVCAGHGSVVRDAQEQMEKFREGDSEGK
jgi:glyoxylase-like metal-dependent hydrolase (beta-lactamase superfamily II)